MWNPLPASLLLVFLASGCAGNTDRAPLLRLIKSLEESTSKVRYDEFARYEGDEKATRLFASEFGEEVEILNSFLAAEVGLSPTARTVVLRLRATLSELADLYESLIAADRFTMTPEESTRRDNHVGAFVRDMYDIGSLADGKPLQPRRDSEALQ